MSVDSMAIAILLGSFFVMVFLRFPIAYAVALSSVFCLMAQGWQFLSLSPWDVLWGLAVSLKN